MLDEEFKKAFADIKTLTERPSNDDLLLLYALFKQSKSGDVSGKRPGMLDLKGRAKYDAWAKFQGTSKDDAKQAYINKVKEMLGKYAHE